MNRELYISTRLCSGHVTVKYMSSNQADEKKMLLGLSFRMKAVVPHCIEHSCVHGSFNLALCGRVRVFTVE